MNPRSKKKRCGEVGRIRWPNLFADERVKKNGGGKKKGPKGKRVKKRNRKSCWIKEKKEKGR